VDFQTGNYTVAVNVPEWSVLAHGIAARIRAGQGYALATLNLDHLEKLSVPGPFRDAYSAQDFVTADGNPIVWCAGLAGQTIDLLPGSDMIVPLARIAAEMGVKLGLVGSTQDSLTGAARALTKAVPGLEVAAMIAPPMGFDPDGADARAILQDLQGAGVGLCFIALGAPKQERLAALGRRVVPEMGFASIGAGLDFLSGTQARAPQWVRRIAMEWAWRIASDPVRMLGRYILSAQILPGHLWRSFRMRQS
jgi:N-acetylglucosaminyldiphosphoundecaprenol N-acetyl-beta-D-mannosaminyltransferase